MMARGNDFFRVVLPWPDWGLSPNSRKHYREKAALTKEARHEAKLLSLSGLDVDNYVDGEKLWALWIFREPDRRRRDTGNMRAAMKAAQDGVFDALKIDDSNIRDEFLHRAGLGNCVELRLYEDWQSWLDDVIVLSKIGVNRER